MGKRTGRPPGRPRKDSIVPSLIKVDAPEEWLWDKARTTCLNLVVKGHTKNDIAKQLGKHRSTISEWCKRPEFQGRLAERIQETIAAVRYRRVRQTTHFADATARLLEKAYAVAEAPVGKYDSFVVADALDATKTLGSEFRAWRKEERTDFGDDVQKKQVGVFIGGTIQHDHKASTRISMRDFLDAKLEDGVIDVEALPNTTDKNRLLTGMIEQVLSDPETTDLLQEEDRDDEE